jgi:hypothetical protein
MFCVILGSPIKLGAFFCLYLAFLSEEITHKVHVMPKLFPNRSGELEQMHIFKTSTRAELTVPVIQSCYEDEMTQCSRMLRFPGT